MKPTLPTTSSHFRPELESTEPKWPHTFGRTTHTTFQEHRRHVWLVCATASLLSARHLLVEQNVHFPLQISLISLAAAVFIVLCLRLSRRRAQDASEQKSRGKTTVRRLLLVTVVQCFPALSLFCLMQAISNFTNLPVLIMMTTIAFFTEGVILLIVGFTPFSPTELLRLSLLAPACAGILITDYRLDVMLMKVSISAMLLAGIASALRKLAIKHYPEDMADRNAETKWLVGMGCLLAVVWALPTRPREHMMMLPLRSVPLLIVNAFSTAAAMLTGNSILFPINTHPDSRSTSGTDASLRRSCDVLTLLTLTGITGCFSTLLLRRSYVNWYQFWCFFFAVLCIGSRAAHEAVWSGLKRRRGPHGRYEIVADSPISQSDDSAANAIVEDLKVPQLQTKQTEPRGISLRTVLVSIAIPSLWISYLLLNFTERTHSRVDDVLDRNYQPSVPLEVVLSMYTEPIYKVNELILDMKAIPALSEAVFTIYLKGEKTDRAQIQQQTPANTVTVLPNIGREGETYLHHILTRWDSLAKQTIFLQAVVRDSSELILHLNNYFDPDRTGFLSLSWPGNVCDCDSCGDKFFWRDDINFLPAMQSRVSNSYACRNILLGYEGQFVVSAARIRGIDKSIYYDLRQALVDEKSWAHQEEYLQGRKDSMSEPWFGYTVERMWNLLFQCSDLDVAWKCPTVANGLRIGGDVGDCQCFD